MSREPDRPKTAKFLQVTDEPEERFDRDAISVAPLDERTDTTADDQETRTRKLRDYFDRPIRASAADDPLHMHSGALRRHADLDSVPEHEFTRLLRELREARGE